VIDHDEIGDEMEMELAHALKLRGLPKLSLAKNFPVSGRAGKQTHRISAAWSRQ
jgi:hypothetical protein